MPPITSLFYRGKKYTYKDVWEKYFECLIPSEYFKTKIYKIRKRWMLELFQHRCQDCGVCEQKGRGLEIHHLRYNETFGHDSPEDLFVVCHACHEKLQGRKMNYPHINLGINEVKK